MSRKSEFQTESPNPAVRFLEWKSNDKQWAYYDKEKGHNVFIDLPKFLTLKELHTVKGFHDPSQSGIFSNEVQYVGSEVLNVRSFKGGDVAKGIYKNIKADILSAGGHYTKSIYVMVESGEIWNLSLKGSVVSEWSDFTQKTRSRLADEWVDVKEISERKKGAVNYSVPIFQFNNSLSDNDAKIADDAYKILKEYFDNYFNKEVEELEIDKVKIVNDLLDELPQDEPDDLPF